MQMFRYSLLAILMFLAPSAWAAGNPQHAPIHYCNGPSLSEFLDIYDAEFHLGYAGLGPHQASEHNWLSLAIYFEARNQSLEAQMAVAQVVINRKEDRRWPSTIRGVVSQGRRRAGASWRSCQFSFMCDGLSETPHERMAWETARQIALLALDGGWQDLSGGATHYHSKKITAPSWTKKMTNAGTAGDHQLWQEN